MGLADTLHGGLDPAPQQEPQEDVGLFNSLTQMTEQSQAMAKSQEEKGQEAKAPFDWNLGPDGFEFKNVDAGLAKQLMDSHKQLQQIRAAFNEEAMRLQEQENRMRSKAGGLYGVISAIAGGLAQDPTLPGWVQGLGRAQLQINQNPQQLADRKLALMSQLAGLDQREQSTITQMQRLADQRAYREQEAKFKAEKEQRLAEGMEMRDEVSRLKLSAADQANYEKNVRAMAAKAAAGKLPPDEIDKLVEAEKITPTDGDYLKGLMRGDASKSQSVEDSKKRIKQTAPGKAGESSSSKEKPEKPVITPKEAYDRRDRINRQRIAAAQIMDPGKRKEAETRIDEQEKRLDELTAPKGAPLASSHGQIEAPKDVPQEKARQAIEIFKKDPSAEVKMNGEIYVYRDGKIVKKDEEKKSVRPAGIKRASELRREQAPLSSWMRDQR